jgi:uncharacterized RmlC-like cupin family protein
MHMHDEDTPRYDGPRELAHSLTAFARVSASGAIWNQEGLRADSEYRDLGLAAVTNGRIGAKHIRALKPFTDPTGWHWHDMTAHYLYVLHGSVTFRFAGVEGDVTLNAGDGLSQPAGVPHNVISRSDDLVYCVINNAT